MVRYSLAILTTWFLLASATEVARGTEEQPASVTPGDSTAHARLDTLSSRSGYKEDVRVDGGGSSVDADLVDDDLKKNPLLWHDKLEQTFDGYYDLKRALSKRHNLALGTDYTFLNQWATWSATDRQAASGAFRVFGTWKLVRSEGHPGALVFRVENRHIIGSGLTPRDLGFEAGSSLSTASFKSFGWGITAFYWKQAFGKRRTGLVVGKMDPGDFSDAYTLLNAWKIFLNDGTFNNPSVALPQQGLGAVGMYRFTGDWYVMGGLHDANGRPTRWGFDTFFNTREYYTWIETGVNPDPDIMSGAGVHLNLWHQDALEAEGSPESWGFTVSASTKTYGPDRWSPFVRAGYSTGDPALVRFIAVIGAVAKMRQGGDRLGIATSISGPTEESLRHQWTTEIYYRLQIAEHMAITPDIQFTVNPSETLERDFIAVASVLRVRISF